MNHPGDPRAMSDETPIRRLVRQMEAMRKALELVGPRHSRDFGYEQTRAVLSEPLPTPAELSDLERWAEIGRLVETMPYESMLEHLDDSENGWFFDPDNESVRKGEVFRMTPLEVLRAALTPPAAPESGGEAQ